jgi:hypothetical protein
VTVKIKLWRRGLLAALIGGAVSGCTSMIVDPAHFNLFNGGARPLAEMATTSAIVGALLYLKQHPLPDQDELDEMQVKVDEKAANGEK